MAATVFSTLSVLGTTVSAAVGISLASVAAVRSLATGVPSILRLAGRRILIFVADGLGFTVCSYDIGTNN